MMQQQPAETVPGSRPATPARALTSPSASDFRPERLVEQRFSVPFEYPVAFCRGVFDPNERTLQWMISRREPSRRHPVFAVADAGLVAARSALAAELAAYAEQHAASLDLLAPLHVVPGGEAAKNDPA